LPAQCQDDLAPMGVGESVEDMVETGFLVHQIVNR
jgi:hypothetical protein